jgi:Predicted transcriptional regulator
MTPIRRLHLGDLEKSVLEHLWSHGSAHAKAVHGAIGRQRGITLNTVQSTLERLRSKGFLRREKVSHAYLYTPQVSREELMTQIIEEVVATFTKGQAEPMLSAFVNLAARVDEENLDRLEQLIATRRREVKGRKP